MVGGNTGLRDAWVGERANWNRVEDYLVFLKQKKAYAHVRDLCRGLDVLDVGCGSGYGTAMLAEVARRVVGVDVNAEIIKFCRSAYTRPNLEFETIPPQEDIGFAEASFDIIVSFQVIEHVPDVPRYLKNLKKLLRPQGKVILTTPNRAYRLLPGQRPQDPEHLREYELEELRLELTQVFPEVEIWGISGTEEINAIEYQRVKPTRWKAYVYLPVVRCLRALLPSPLFSLLKNIKSGIRGGQAPLPLEMLESRYTLDDLFVRRDLQNSLDFLAICSNQSG